MSGAVDRFLEAARVEGLEPDVRRFPEGTKTADDAARAIGCDVGQIVKSLVFMADDRPVMAFTSGANRVDEAKLAEIVGAASVRRATPEEARAATGFAVGGTPPFGHPERLTCVVDHDLLGVGRDLGRGRHPGLRLPALARRSAPGDGGSARGVRRRSSLGPPPMPVRRLQSLVSARSDAHRRNR